MVISLLLACASGPDPIDTGVVEAAMDPTELLTRASLDLRRHRPDVQELQLVEDDPSQLEPLIEEFLYDEGLQQAVIDAWGVVLRTRLDDWPRRAQDFGLTSEARFARSVGEEPLRLMAAVASEDLPWTTILRADWTMANGPLAAAWPLDLEDLESDWQRTRYTDGRPAAGVLATNGLWWRYETTRTNRNRGRANAVARIFTCTDFLDRSIQFDRDVDLSDQELADRAIHDNPGCASCHSSLDPIASYLGGFYFPNKSGEEEMVRYHPERENIWRWLTGAPPAWFGEPGQDLNDLGLQIAQDPRFVQCAVQQTSEWLLQRPMTLDDTRQLTLHRERFIRGDLTLRALIRSIMASPAYRTAPTDDPQRVSRKRVSPELLAEQVEHLTGFRLSIDGYDLLNTDSLGLRVMAGGADGEFVTEPSLQATATSALVQERLAQAAASWAVLNDRDRPQEERLFSDGQLSAQPDDATLADQINTLHLRVLSQPLGQEDELELVDHWRAVHQLTDSPADAWESVLTVLLRHPSFMQY